jgi:hypothetical protein
MGFYLLFQQQCYACMTDAAASGKQLRGLALRRVEGFGGVGLVAAWALGCGWVRVEGLIGWQVVVAFRSGEGVGFAHAEVRCVVAGCRHPAPHP